MSATDNLIEELRAGLEGVTPGPWMVYDGCSWRRIGTAHGRRDDCAVLAPYRASDGHPDLYASRGNDVYANLEHIARCSPDNIRTLLDTIARLEEENGRYRAALKSIVGMDSHIDATVSGGRKVVHGPLAAVAARALSTGDAG